MKQGSVWQVNLDPTIGSEIKKSRPCLILNNDKIGKLPLKIVAPITDFKEHYALVPWMVALEPTKENGLSKKSAIDLFQVRSVSEQRLSRKIGNVHKAILDRCKRSLDIVFEIQH
jgi:mRNA interferase MazF